MITKFGVGQVFYTKQSYPEGFKWFPVEITKVTAKTVFFTFKGKSCKASKQFYGNAEIIHNFSNGVFISASDSTVNPDLETLENQPSDNLETLENQTPSTCLLGQSVIRCHGKDEKTLLGTVTEIKGGLFIVTCLDGIEYWEDDLNILPDTEFNRATYGLSVPQTSVKSEPVSNVIDMFTRKPLQV